MTLKILVTNTDPRSDVTVRVATRRPDGSPSPSWADVELMGGECRMFYVHSEQHLVITTDEPQNAPIKPTPEAPAALPPQGGTCQRPGEAGSAAVAGAGPRAAAVVAKTVDNWGMAAPPEDKPA
jgi:hypothetical protein